MRELRIFGPPGTGKTTTLSTKEIPGAVAKYGADRVLVSSFTRAAAREIASRDLPVPDENVGTLHRLCYHYLGRPVIAETEKKYIQLWNEKHGDFWNMRGSYKPDVDEGGAPDATSGNDDGAGDEALNRLNILRNRLAPESMWPDTVRQFATLWRKFKADFDVVDFTDLIERAVNERPRPPNDAAVMFLDEAQDFTPLQLKLVRSWGYYLDWFVLVGDDDQTIYGFTGASPDAFLNPPIDAKYKRVLQKSHRCSKAVHSIAKTVLARISNREPKEYFPTDEEGSIDKDLYLTYKKPEWVLQRIRNLLSEGRESVMVLGSCSYMLDGVKKVLKKEGIPFHNPYRRTRGDWNPLHSSDTLTTGRDIVASFLGSGVDGPYWNVPQLVKWARVLKVGPDGLKRNTGKKAIAALRKAIKDQQAGLHTSREILCHVLEQNALQRALDRDIGWLFDAVKKERRPAMEFPLTVVKNHGLQALTETPKVIIGTIHSVKGGEADSVILFPDISYAAHTQLMKHTEYLDDIARLFYVGITRAKHTVVFGRPVNYILDNRVTP